MPKTTPKSLNSLVYAEVDLQKLRNNYINITSKLNRETKFLAVVKANAYGHGISRISQELEKLGADYFGVSNISEGLAIRAAGVQTPVLVFGYPNPNQIGEAIQHDLTLTVCHPESLEQIKKIVDKQLKPAKVHVQVDTGMNMYGVRFQQAEAFIKRISGDEWINLEGIYSHFADAEAEDLTEAFAQLELFKTLVSRLKQLGIEPPLLHIANGAATVRMKDSHFTMVRTGTFLYGKQSGTQLAEYVPEQILTLKTKTTNIFDLKKGEAVGYERTTATSQRKLACIPVGYGDGLRKSPNWKYVYTNNKLSPIFGEITMDKTIIDVTGINDIEIEDEVILIGEDDEKISLNAIASRIGASNYEILCGLSDRVQRLYLS